MMQMRRERARQEGQGSAAPMPSGLHTPWHPCVAAWHKLPAAGQSPVGFRERSTPCLVLHPASCDQPNPRRTLHACS